eukprot:scaffold22920_cov36-Cyclotella_meneghiniana.AAC.1
MDDTQIALIILANIKVAATQEYGSEFKTALQTIRRQYNYSHVHDATSIAAILTELAAADAVWQLKDAPAPSKRFANAVADQSPPHTSIPTTTKELPWQHRTTIDQHHPANVAARQIGRRIKRRARRRTNPRKSRSCPKIKHKCPHCRAQKRGSEHPKHIPFDKCNWNPDYKGYRQGWVCRILGIDFKPRKDFTPELGGYAKSAQTSSDDSSSSSGSDDS